MSPGFYFLLLENRLSIFFAFFPIIIQSLKNSDNQLLPIS